MQEMEHQHPKCQRHCSSDNTVQNTTGDTSNDKMSAGGTFNLHQQQLKGMWYTYTLLSKVKSKLGNTCTNVYTQGKFTQVIPMTSQTKDARKSLVDFTDDDVRIPE